MPEPENYLIEDDLSNQKAFFIDMDGVINKGNSLIPGAKGFVDRLKEGNHKFLFITNNSYFTAADLRNRLASMGLEADESCFFTSAMSTANFLENQNYGCRAYVIGGPGLRQELESAGVRITAEKPDYVIVGETEEYDYMSIIEATHLIQEGARFIATNQDITGPTPRGPVPACGALVAPIERVTGVKAYFLGKPNPVMMYWARKKLKVHTRNSFMIGDRMDTDIVGGLEAGMTCCLVLTGVTSRDALKKFPYKPDYIFESVDEIDPDRILSKWDKRCRK
jgi:NagD protein